MEVTMNPVIENMLTRRSIRKYKKEKVSEETIRLLLMAAMNAPSACNQQAWYFIVVTEEDKLNKLSQLHSGVRFVKQASCAIIICGEPDAAILDYYWLDDCAAATQNLLLAAHSLGLGATWTGINHTDPDSIAFYRQILSIPKKYIPFSMIPVGYPSERKPSNNRYDEEKVLWQ